MNFLAHIYLSGDNELVKIGNFMADNITGNKYEHFPEDVQKGIMLHRAIDSYTDAHPVFRQGTKRLHPVYHHYAGVIMDMFYDHFLAKNWQDYHHLPLKQYARILTQMDNRTKNKSGMRNAVNELIQYYDTFEAEFREFFKDLQNHVKEKSAELGI